MNDFQMYEEGREEMENEYILCAAIKYNDTVIAGYRHRDCYTVLRDLIGQEVVDTDDYSDGFITSTNRYVGRKEAYNIAFNKDQIIGPNKGYSENEIGLTSEDLY